MIAASSKYSFSEEFNTEFEKAGVPMVGTLGVAAGDYSNPYVFMLNNNLSGSAGAGAVLQHSGAKTIAFISADNPAARFLPQFITPVLENGKADLINETYLPLDPSVDVAPFVGRVIRCASRRRRDRRVERLRREARRRAAPGRVRGQDRRSRHFPGSH